MVSFLGEIKRRMAALSNDPSNLALLNSLTENELEP